MSSRPLNGDIFMETGYPSLAAMFKHRMIREGRGDEYVERSRKARADGLRHRGAVMRVHGEMGYDSTDAEREYYDAWREERKAAREVAREPSRHERELVEARDKAIVGLTAYADREAELAWVAAHPSMRSKDAEIDAAAILDPPAGRAPSQRACNMLLHLHEFEDERKQFWREIVKIAVKQKVEEGEVGAGPDEAPDVGADRAFEMVNAMRGE